VIGGNVGLDANKESKSSGGEEGWWLPGEAKGKDGRVVDQRNCRRNCRTGRKQGVQVVGRGGVVAEAKGKDWFIERLRHWYPLCSV
jgi:hypothetical protein